MMLDFCPWAQRHNPAMSPVEAITRGCHVRFRPINDDHHGRPDGRFAHCPWHGRGRRPGVPWAWPLSGPCLFPSLLRSTSRLSIIITWKNCRKRHPRGNKGEQPGAHAAVE